MFIFNHDNIDADKIRIISLRIIEKDIDEFVDLIKCYYDRDLTDDIKKIKITRGTDKYNNLEYFNNLPPFKYNTNIAFKMLTIKVCGETDRDIFSDIFKTKVLPSTKTLWYCERPAELKATGIWKSSTINKTKYPLYIISKGRYERRYTENAIKKMNCPYYLVVEEDEYDLYKKHGGENLLMFSNADKKHFTSGIYENDAGSIPVRNFIWKHSLKQGHKKHWCIDDNIREFYRFYDNKRSLFHSCAGFRAIEIFSDRYENIKMSGMNYKSFMPELETKRTPIALNTRIYSCILLSNDANQFMDKKREDWQGDFLWRGKYNEDTDLSLRLLKSGMPTALFNTFLCDKMTTMSVKGGNTSSIYQNDGLQKKLDSLLNQHGDVARGTYRFKKVHHYVDYRPFSHLPLIKKENYTEEPIDWGLYYE